jgi:cobalt-zinc-cadmium efflux system outer membrane protein
MRRLSMLLLLAAGCHACCEDVPGEIEGHVAALGAEVEPPGVVPCGTVEPVPDGPLDLPALWRLALAKNPDLRQAAADVEAARGQWIQAAKYPNPRFIYRENVLGTPQNPAGDLTVEATQEIVTAGKRQLDIAIAERGTGASLFALRGQKFEVLTRVRRAYADYLSWGFAEGVSAETVKALERAVEITRGQVEVAKIRPRSDLVRLRAVLQEAQLSQGRARTSREAAWRQLAAEVGVPDLPPPEAAVPEEPIPEWARGDVVKRVLAANTELKQAAVEAERARLQVARARAEAVPNVTVGSGYSANYPEHQQGGTLAFETALPLWDRNQGRIHEAQARWAKAQVAQQSVADRLLRDTAEAFGRYQAARQQVTQLTADILPALQESTELVRRGYQAGGPQLTFADVLLAEENLSSARLRLAEARRELGRAAADLAGLMQLDVAEDLCTAAPSPP